MEADRHATPRPRTPRIVLRVPDPQKFRSAYVRDLADGGVFVKSEKLLAMGAAVEVELHPPGAEHLALPGRVDRRVEPGGPSPAGMHVAFENLDAATSRRLLELVAAFVDDPVADGGERTNPGGGSPAADDPVARRPPPVPTLTAEAWPPPLAAPWNDAVPTVPAATDREDGIREVAELRGRLAAAEATIASLRAELAAHEEDEAGTRALAERLALQKNKLERARKREAEEAAAERERLHAELAARTDAVHALEVRAAEAEARVEVERSGRLEAEDRATEWKERCEEASVGRTEALARAEKLVGQVEEAERMALDAEERADELSGKLQAAQAELARAVEAGAGHEGRATALARDLEAAGEALRLERARAEDLAARLSSAEEAGRAARAEADERANRLVATQETHAAERERLLAELAAVTARAGEAAAAGSRTEERLRDAETRLGEARARVAELEGRAAGAEERLARLHTKERDLRRLLAVLSAKVEEDAEGVEDDAAAAEGARPNDRLEDGPHGGAAPASPDGAEAPRDRRAAHGGVILAADLLAEAGMTVEPPAPDGDIPVDVDLEEPTAEGPGFPEFASRLAGGSRVRRTEKFRRYKPTEPSEIRLGTWLVQADSLDALRELARGKLAGDRLPRLLFDFHRRGLVELVG